MDPEGSRQDLAWVVVGEVALVARVFRRWRCSVVPRGSSPSAVITTQFQPRVNGDPGSVWWNRHVSANSASSCGTGSSR